MAKTDRAPIYKTKIGDDEPQEAKKGDTRTFKDDEGKDAEYESLGTNQLNEDEAISEGDRKEWQKGSNQKGKPNIGTRDGLRMEYWRPKKKS